MIYLLIRQDHVEYDEYDGLVIAADSEEQAREMAIDEYWEENTPFTCSEVEDQYRGVVLESFNAG